MLYLDIWRLPEIEKCRQELYPHVTAAQAALRYTDFGGTIRLVLAKVDYTFAQLKAEVGAESVAALINMDLLGFRDKKISHSLAHIHVSIHEHTVEGRRVE